MTKKIMIMAGGTGGHVFPGIAVAEYLRQKNVEIVWLGTLGGMEKEWVEKAQIPFFNISIKGLRGNGLKGWLKAPFNVTLAWWQARRIMKQTQPDLVLGMGGFVCGPGGLAAKFLGIPLVIHEQNAIPGLTNRLLAPLAKKVICAFPQQTIKGNKVVTLGNPIRQGFETIETRSPKPPFRLLVVGGSRGALALNETVPQALALLPEEMALEVLHQTGQKTLQQAEAAYQQAGVKAEVVAFIEDMRTAYEQADLVVCRSGALTVSELMGAARPAIMVPFPFAVDDHQTANAQALVNIEGGEVIAQRDLTAERLASRLQTWLHQETLQVASETIRAKAPTQATEKIGQLLLEELK